MTGPEDLGDIFEAFFEGGDNGNTMARLQKKRRNSVNRIKAKFLRDIFFLSLLKIGGKYCLN